MFCCEYFYDLSCIASCDELTFTIPNLPIGEYRIEYTYPFSNHLHVIDVITSVVDELILPQRFNYNLVYFKIYDILNDIYISQATTINGIDVDVSCYKFRNIQFSHHSNIVKEVCLIDKNKVWMSVSISNLYNFKLSRIKFCDYEIDFSCYCNQDITGIDGKDLLDNLFNLLNTCTSLSTYLNNNGIIFNRVSDLQFDIIAEKVGCCCDSKIELYNNEFELFGVVSRGYCCNNNFNIVCRDGGNLNKGTLKFEFPLCSESTFRSGISCLPEESTIVLSNYCFSSYEEMAEYLNGQNLNAYLEAVENGIIAYLDFGSFNEQINICGVELVVCENDVVIKTHTVNCCPAPAPFVFFDIVEAVKMIFEKRV